MYNAMKRISLLVLFMLLFYLPASGATFNRSIRSGLASTANNWSTGTSPCATGGDGIFVSVQTTIVLNCSLGSSATGINKLSVEAGGSLCSYDGTHTSCGYTSSQGAQTIYFDSTGTDAIGSGSITNPGSDATAFGVFMGHGIFQFIGSPGNVLTFTAADGSSPIYIVHQQGGYDGGTGIGTGGETGGGAQGTYGAVFSCYYCKFENVGSSSFPQYMEGLAYALQPEISPAPSLDIENSEFDAPYEFTLGNAWGYSQNSNWTMKSNWFNGPTAQYLANMVGFMGITFINNTETGATTSGSTVQLKDFTGITWQGNVSVGSADGTVQRGQVSAAYDPLTLSITGNLCLNAEGANPQDCWNANLNENDTTSAVSGNIAWGCNNCYHFLNPTGCTSAPTISNNWGSVYQEAADMQGVFESDGSCFIIKNNIAIEEQPTNEIAMLFYEAVAGGGFFQLDNNTVYYVTRPSDGDGINLGDGQGDGYINSPSWLRSNLVVSSYYGLDSAISNNFSTSQCNGDAGVCNNLMYNTVTAYCHPNGACSDTPTGTGYWDGVHEHPNAIYGDLANTVNPSFVDATRRPTGYDTLCGGAGTLADLGTQYSYRTGLGMAYNSCFNISSMLKWLQAGFAPTNQALAKSGWGGTYIGAVPPVSYCSVGCGTAFR
jgi:hypothetical protein